MNLYQNHAYLSLSIKSFIVPLSLYRICHYPSSPISPRHNISTPLEQMDKNLALSCGVAEFKGPTVFGVVRLAQVSNEVAMIQANLTGLPRGMRAWSINQFGDLTRGAATTGPIFNPINNQQKAVGDLGMLNFDEKSETSFTGMKEKLNVIDVIGRSIVVYGSEDRSDQGIAAAVVAISAAGIDGQSCNRLCACDGSTIWEPTNPHSLTKC